MASKYYRGFQKLFTFGKSAGENTGKSINTIVGVPPAKNLKKRFDTKADINKSVDKSAGSLVSNQKKSEIKNKASKDISRIYDKYEKKADGGRIGKRFGGDTMKKKTNIQKIKETFGPKKKNLSPKQMKIAKLAGNPNKIDGADFKKLRGRG